MPVAEADAEAAASVEASAAVAVATAVASTSSPGNDDTLRLASPLSTPTTATSPVSPTFLSVAGRVSTPLSLFIDSAPSSGKKKSTTSPESESAAAVRQRYLAMSPTAAAIAPGAASADATESRLAEASKTEADAAADAESLRRALREQEREQERDQEQEEQEEQDEAGWREKNLSTSAGAGTGPPLPWSPSSTTSSSNPNINPNSIITAAASLSLSLSPTAGDIKHDLSRGVISAPLPQSPNRHERPSISARDSDIATLITGAYTTTTAATSIATVASNSAGSGSRAATVRIPAPAPALEEAPLHTGSVQPGTKLAHPKPILHIATDVSISSPSKHSDLLTRSASAVSNVAHLEATAERLSMTSSIDDAIRELHCELKRSDSRRSSILAARAASADEHSTRLRRYPSNSSSSAAAAARQKGYSPAYVMSPTNSLSGRMRSGSNASTGRPEHEVINSILSRHGPGKSSVRSVRSAKPSLAEISESEPISLTQHVLDQVDAVPPFEHAAAASSRSIIEQDAVGVPQTDEFHNMLEGGFRSHRASNLVLVNPDLPSEHDEHDEHDGYEAERPMTANSTNTFQVAQDAFVDFDGAHCETDNEDDRFATADMGSRSQKRDRLSEVNQLPAQQQPPAQMPQSQTRPPVVDDELFLPTPQQSSAEFVSEFVRPQSYFDQQTGQHMLYYPARVPAMLNLPPKLSNKPKAADRNQRRSQILSAMMQPKENKRKSVVPDLDQIALPDPLSGHRNSFAALTLADNLEDTDDATTPTPFLEEPAPQSRNGSALSLEDLRRPQRLSKMDTDKHQSNIPNLENIPPHLRASVFFDQPSLELPEIEVKDGSAMATLDSILDASATAPVSAFTDHLYAGKLGSETYGKEKKKKASKHKQQPSTNTLGAALAEAPKEQSTIRLLTKRSQSSLFGRVNKGPDPNDNAHDGADEEGEHEEEEEEEVDEGILDGMPTTLLGEIHLRKQQQKQRILNQGNVAPQGMRATLLEMDAVAEMQRKQRLKQRVNLAWEEQNVAAEQTISDDEDTPLAVIAAMHQGAKNMADVDRPIGLMEMRQLEENEPLSSRAARLQGRASAVFNAKRQSNLSLPVTRMAEVQPPASPRIIEPDASVVDEDARTTIAPEPEPLAAEIEEETLGARKRRLAESQLPKARPVSSTFSAELLGQFADPEESKPKPNTGVEDETLGQRRRRLQAEREAREREMSYGNLTGERPGERPVSYGNPMVEPPRRGVMRRVSMADMLSVHQNVQDPRIAEQRRQQEEHMRLAQQDAMLAAVRSQMPTALVQNGNARPGGFKGGLYNDGTGGLGVEAARSSTALNQFQTRSFTNTGSRNRATMMAPPNGFGMAQGGLHPSYSNLTSFGSSSMNGRHPMAGMNPMKPVSMYGAGNLYGANGLIQPNIGIPMSNPNGQMDRVERWRQGVFP